MRINLKKLPLKNKNKKLIVFLFKYLIVGECYDAVKNLKSEIN